MGFSNQLTMLLVSTLSATNLISINVKCEVVSDSPGHHEISVDRTDKEIATVTAKIWYVSDFHGKYTNIKKYDKVDENCVDSNTDICERVIAEVEHIEMIPEEVRNSWRDGDTPHNRAQAVVNVNIDYMNSALQKSQIPIRFVQWGSVQDIGKTEKEIGSGYTVPGPGATRTATDVKNSVKNVFGDSEEGRLRLYQTADVVLLLINNGMQDASGMSFSALHEPEGSQKEYRFAVFVGGYNNGWLFSHEAGHCLGGMHLRPNGNMNSRTNYAYCPPDGEFGTIEAYVWNCHPGPSGEQRGKVPYYSNPNVQVEGVATGSQTENNAKYMTDNRFASASAGTNCLDGNPDDAWMMFMSDGKIGDNCPNGEESYDPPLESTRVNCEYGHWGTWEGCDKPCGSGSQIRRREVTRQPWFGGTLCTDEKMSETRKCNEMACPACDDPKQISGKTLSCESSKSFGHDSCDNTIDGNESTVWTSGLNAPDYNDPKTLVDHKIQWGYNTFVKLLFKKELVVTGVQIINKVEEEYFYENYKDVMISFSDGFEKQVSLSPSGKQNRVFTLEHPVQSSFVNILGVSTFSHMPEGHFPGTRHSGYRSGISEIRIFGCDAESKTKIDGGWSEWESWTHCSASCGVGSRSRSRNCASPKPSKGGDPCTGLDTTSEACEEKECPSDICFIVTHTSKRDANENWWKLGTCSNKHPHLDLSTANTQCCLPPGEYTLECKDSWGDGWGGAYMTIAGKRYCDNFQTGSVETHEILIGKETVPDDTDGKWIPGRLCFRDRLKVAFQGNKGYELEKAKKECELACDNRSDCQFGSLYFTATRQDCYLHGQNCGNWQSYEHRLYYLYKKGMAS